MRVDEDTLKEIDKRRQALRGLLNKFSFGLADNLRWMPQAARFLFEREIDRVNSEGQKLLSDLLKGDIEDFVNAREAKLVADIGAMYQALDKKAPVSQRVYEAQTSGLGTYFLDSLFSDIDSLLIHAGVHTVVFGYQRCLSKRVPFAVYYSVDGELIRVHWQLLQDWLKTPTLATLIRKLATVAEREEAMR